MDIHIPLFYQIQARKKGARSSTSHIVFIEETFKVQSLSANEAPVAISNFDRQTRGDKAGLLRLYNDELWMQECDLDGQIATPASWATKISTPAYNRDKNSVKANSIWENFCDSISLQHRGTMFSNDEFREIESSTIDAHRALYVDNLSNNFKIIDGHIYGKVSEPFFIVKKTKQTAECLLVFNDDTTEREFTEIFRIDHYDEMIDSLNAREKLMTADSRPEVIFTEILQHPHEENTLINLGNYVVDQLAFSVRGFKFDLGMAWFSLRDAASECETDLCESNMNNLEEHLRNFRTLISDTDIYQKDDMVDAINLGLNRWEMRPTSIDFNNYSL